MKNETESRLLDGMANAGRPPRIFSAKEKEEIEMYYRGGKGLNELAKQLRTDSGSIRRILIEAGCEIRAKHRPSGASLEDAVRWRGMYEGGMSRAAIAETEPISIAIVRGALEKVGAPIRSGKVERHRPRLGEGKDRQANPKMHDASIKAEYAQLYRQGPENSQAFAERYPERVKASRDKYRAENPERARADNRSRRARLAEAPGSHTTGEVGKLYQDQGGMCFYCLGDLPESSWHVDHLVALAIGGSNDAVNLCACCRSCNSKKGMRTPYAWMERMAELGYVPVAISMYRQRIAAIDAVFLGDI